MRDVREQYSHQKQASNFIQTTDLHLLVVAPTGAGKSEIGYEALGKYGRGLYVAPTRALCYEKWQELEQYFPSKRVVIGNKDYSLGKNTFRGSDIRVVTPWKLIQLLQYEDFSKQVPVVVFDEIHNLEREFEVIVTTMKEWHPQVRRVGLSATIDDADEKRFAAWLDAIVVKSEERPVPLVERIIFFDSDLDEDGNEITRVKIIERGFVARTETLHESLKKNTHLEYIRDRISEQDVDNPPVLWFSPYRWRAAEIASVMAENSDEYSSELNQLSGGMSWKASEFSESLIAALSQACGFHHGGLSQQEREMVFELAQAGKLKNIGTCFTLMQGVNLPARHVVLDTVYDYGEDENGQGSEKRLLDISKFRQLEGRAGRPQFDTIGYVWIPVFSEVELVEVQEVLLKYKASKLESRIFNTYFMTAVLPQLVRHGFDTPEKIAGFIRATYWGMAMQDNFPLMDQVQSILSVLIDKEVVRVEDEKLVLTRAGAQMARLNLHPDEYFSIHHLVREMNLDYGEWIENLVHATAGYIIGQDEEKKETALNEIKMYGLAVYTAKVKHYTRDMADYISRLFDITRSYFRLNRRMDGYEEEWEESVGRKFLFGQLQLAARLSEVLRRDQLKRLIRNVGSALTEYSIHDEPTQRSVAKLLFSHCRVSPNGLASKVAEIIGADPDYFHQMVDEEMAKARTISAEKEVN